ncbi:hypothetical protein OIDMADRAFT_34238 [Oidiodendron maius Zn]|uniref:Beta-lactamase-related domain-containing protein n=1 Tax=Oidiodendron maius (strain Zn) TaxID=913774 RepID=A0A0C3GW38_OIDMZ|nr:hypothetical protein OIDMADRAFT_34238 [Oidiodendron maius Zn]
MAALKFESGYTCAGARIHTWHCGIAGFGYTFFNSEIRTFGYPIGIDEFSGRVEDLYAQPLLFEPGTNINYGTNIDCVGIIVEKATGMSLEGYIRKFIFAPLNMKNATFFPTEEQKSRLVHMSQRAPDGSITDGSITGREHVFRLPLVVNSEEQENIFYSGGCGCYGEPKEFTNIISMLLSSGSSPITGAQLLQPETVDQMFTNQIPQWTNFGRTPIITGRPEYANSVAELYPQPHDQPQGFGLTIFLTIKDRATGRGKNTGFWGGPPNLFWWVDRERGVSSIVGGQLVPFVDSHVIATWAKVETLLYQG